MPKEIKLQCTLTDNDYLGWVFEKMQVRRGTKNYLLVRRAWEEWVENHEAQLAGWGMSADDWKSQTGGNVASIESQRRRRTKKTQPRPQLRNETGDGALP